MDIFGLACSLDEAALKRLRKDNPVSIAHNKDMGGLIYKRNGKYFATPAVGGTADGFIGPGTFRPLARLSRHCAHAIVTDHLGTPIRMYDRLGRESGTLDFAVYGKKHDEGFRG